MAQDVKMPTGTLTGTMTTLTPSAAVVGLMAEYLTTRHVDVTNNEVIYATIVVTAAAHGVKKLLMVLFPKTFGQLDDTSPPPAPPQG